MGLKNKTNIKDVLEREGTLILTSALACKVNATLKTGEGVRVGDYFLALEALVKGLSLVSKVFLSESLAAWGSM